MVHDMLWIFKRFLKCDPYLILHRGLINLMPFMGLISIKLGLLRILYLCLLVFIDNGFRLLNEL